MPGWGTGSAQVGHDAPMSSWRDTASEQAQSDLDLLLEVTLPFAEQQLEKRGEFFPYGAAVGDAGEVRQFASYDGDEHPTSVAVLDMLIAGLRGERDSLRATAIVADVRLPELDGEAVRVELEHRDGHAITVLRPYVKRRLGHRVDYRDLVAIEGEPQVWVD